MRKVEAETSKVRTGGGVAVSSYKALSFNLMSPHVVARLAKRLSVGGDKYGSVQWRQGINDAEYVADRFNHGVQHLLNFMAHGNTKDDELAGAMWAIHCLMEVERLCPNALKNVVGLCDLHGATASVFHQDEATVRKFRSEVKK
jgi:hypothetical protein